MPFSSPPLSPMPFGNAQALDFVSVASCGVFLQQLPKRPSRFESLGPEHQFRLRLSALSFPGVHLLAGTGTAKAIEHETSRATLVIAFGRCESVIQAGAERHRWASPHHAFFIPPGQRVTAESSAGAFLRLDIEESALAATAAGLAAVEPVARPAIDLQTTRPLALQAGGIHWQQVMRSLCETVDAFGGSGDRLRMAGFEDVVLRTVALMLRPEWLGEQPGDRRVARRFDLDPLLERIQDQLTDRITLSDLEAWSGRSARALQLAFQDRFGVGPMQWLRERRLDLVYQRLQSAGAALSIRALAKACGLTRMATFIPEYERRFGELPSQTRRRGCRARSLGGNPPPSRTP